MSVSWLRAEAYALGECDEAERLAIEAAASADPAVREMLDAIAADLRPLPALRPRDAGLPARGERSRWWWAAPLALAAAAVIAALLPEPEEIPPAERGVKGGTLAIELVREREGSVQEGASHAEPGDRLKVRLTCPPGAAAYDVVVYQGGSAAFPLPPGTIACGNRVPLAGAFTIDPGPATVCAVVDPPSREALAPDLGEAADRAVCAPLR